MAPTLVLVRLPAPLTVLDGKLVELLADLAGVAQVDAGAGLLS
jgi:hypothetical protein